MNRRERRLICRAAPGSRRVVAENLFGCTSGGESSRSGLMKNKSLGLRTAARTSSAATRYRSSRTGGTNRVSALLSKPAPPPPSAGNRSAGRTLTPNRSRTVLLYSSRLSRWSKNAPWIGLPRSELSASVERLRKPENQPVALVGRGLRDAGRRHRVRSLSRCTASRQIFGVFLERLHRCPAPDQVDSRPVACRFAVAAAAELPHATARSRLRRPAARGISPEARSPLQEE